jgi:hypothetical protein
MRRLVRSLRDTYLGADPRSLGLFRIAFGLLLLIDLLHRYEELDFWYTNAGLLPNHTLQWRPPAGHMFSLFFLASTRAEASVGFGLCALAYLLFTLGYKTRTLQVAVLLCRVSINSRLALLENGGDMVVNLLAVLTLALPLGRRFSIDAFRLGLRSRAATHVEGLNAIDPRPLERTPVFSLAMLGLILQFAAIYFFNAASKVGTAWTDGCAVHYALHQDKYVTWFGVWMREHLAADSFRFLTWTTLRVEWTGFALIITPLFAKRARLLAVLLLPPLHTAFALGLNLGTFSAAMISFYPLLLMTAHWEALHGWLKRRAVPLTVELDSNDAALLARAHVLRELDRFGSIRWESSSAAGWRVRGLQAQADTRAPMIALVRALPWGFAAAWLLRIPAFGWLLARVLVAAVSITAMLVGADHGELPMPNREWRATHWLREGAVAMLLLAIVTEAVNDNTSVPLWMRVPQPAWSKAVIEYPRLLQGWRMFAPDPPMTDSMIYVDAITASGKHVDPYNAAASRQRFPSGSIVPERMGQSQFFTMYSDRIAQPGYAAYRQAFLEWLLAYPQRTGRRTDCLTSFEVYLVTDRSPLPGQHARATPLQRERFMDYRAPFDSECKSLQLNAEPRAVQTHAR